MHQGGAEPSWRHLSHPDRLQGCVGFPVCDQNPCSDSQPSRRHSGFVELFQILREFVEATGQHGVVENSRCLAEGGQKLRVFLENFVLETFLPQVGRINDTVFGTPRVIRYGSISVDASPQLWKTPKPSDHKSEHDPKPPRNPTVQTNQACRNAVCATR